MPERSRASSSARRPARRGSARPSHRPPRRAGEEGRGGKKAPAKKAAAKKAPAKKKAGRPRRRRPKKAAAKKAAGQGGRQEGAGAKKAPADAGSRDGHPVRRRLDAELVRRGLAPQPRAGPGRHRGGPRHRRRRAGRPRPPAWSTPGEAVVVAGPRRRFVGRGGEKLDAALDRFGDRPLAGARALDAGARPAASPTACCSGAPPRSWRSTSAAASSTSGCGPTPGSRSRERTNVRDLAARRPSAAPCRPRSWPTCRSSRCGRCSPALARPGRARRRSRAAGEAAVRGRAGGGVPRAGRDPRSRRAGARVLAEVGDAPATAAEQPSWG